MILVRKCNLHLNNLSSIFMELHMITDLIRADFNNEKRELPHLTIPMIDNYLQIIESSERAFIHFTQIGIENIDEKSVIKNSLTSFFRAFENPFLGSERWHLRILQLIEQLSYESIELDNILQKLE